MEELDKVYQEGLMRKLEELKELKEKSKEIAIEEIEKRRYK